MISTDYLRGATLILAMLAIAGCGPREAPPPEDKPAAASTPAVADAAAQTPDAAPSLGGVVWLAQEIRSKPVSLPSEARRPTIQFDVAGGGASGFAGCNSFQGKYRATDSAIHLGPFSTTRRACPDTDQLERDYLRAMAATQTYRVTKDSLEFLGADGTVVLTYRAK
jgi:putative lipoprotein